eukprot:6727486-Alexandrium_andersonii.AAC.1
MSDIGDTVQLEDVWDDIDTEMSYLMNLLEAPSQEGQADRRALADAASESAPDLIRALFAAGATPGE